MKKSLKSLLDQQTGCDFHYYNRNASSWITDILKYMNAKQPLTTSSRRFRSGQQKSGASTRKKRNVYVWKMQFLNKKIFFSNLSFSISPLLATVRWVSDRVIWWFRIFRKPKVLKKVAKPFSSAKHKYQVKFKAHPCKVSLKA